MNPRQQLIQSVAAKMMGGKHKQQRRMRLPANLGQPPEIGVDPLMSRQGMRRKPRGAQLGGGY